MKRILPFLQSSFMEILGFLLLIVVYWWATQVAGPPSGQELHLLEASREALQNHHFFYPTFNDALNVPISPLLTVFVSIVFKFFSTTLLTARAIVLVISLFTLLTFYILGARLFHPTAGALSTCFLFASWGFFSNSHIANGAMLYVMLVLIALILFFHWFDSAFRSRTFARSLYVHFIMMGVTLGLAFCTHGIPGILFPLAIMATAVFISNRPELLADVHYPWLLVPLGGIVALWSLLGILSIGLVPFLFSLIRFNFGFGYLLEPFLYLLPILPFLIPALSTKDIWTRALTTYHKSLFLLFAWIGWSFVFLLLFADFHESYALLAVAPLVLWLGFYLGEVFRNPLFPVSLQLVVDSIIMGGLILSVCSIILSFQLVPHNLFPSFIVLSFLLPIISIILLVLRDYTISRTLPFYIIPFSLLLCILAKSTLAPLFQLQPAQELSDRLSQSKLQDANASVLEWVSDKSPPSAIRFLTPLRNKVIYIDNQDQLESRIQTRNGPVYLILPEEQFYNLPYSVREEGYPLGTAWQWKKPLSPWTLIRALQNEMLDFKTLAEPVVLFEVPVANQDS